MLKSIRFFCAKCNNCTHKHSTIEEIKLCLACARSTIEEQTDNPIHFEGGIKEP